MLRLKTEERMKKKNEEERKKERKKERITKNVQLVG